MNSTRGSRPPGSLVCTSRMRRQSRGRSQSAAALQTWDPATLVPTVEGVRGIPLIMASLGGLCLLVMVLPSGAVAGAFPRLTMLGCAIGVVLTLRDPKYALPVFLAVLAPLRLLGTTIRVNVGGYPVTPISLALATLVLVSVVSRWRPMVVQSSRSSYLWIWIAIAVSAVPALWTDPPVGNDPMITRLIFVMGVVEPAILFLLIYSWFRAYRDIYLFLTAMLTSSLFGVVTGLVIIRTGEFAVTSESLNMLRFNLSGFGGANTSGIIWVLLYPLILIFQTRRIRDFILNVMPALFFIWGMALAGYSRSTPVVLGLQTLIYLLWSAMRRRSIWLVAIVGLMFVLTIVLVPAEFRRAWTDRFSESDLTGMLLGNPKELSASDEFRYTTRTSLVEQIKARPWGGYAAVGIEDPENLYMDIALQLGWGPLFWFLGLQFLLLRRTWRATTSGERSARVMNKLVFSALLGMALYGATTGVNLVKAGGSSDSDARYSANNMPALFFAAVGAFALFVSGPGHRAVAPRAHALWKSDEASVRIL